jgi:trans-2-enoyl-CoA reductase
MCVAYRLLEDHGSLKPGDAVILNAANGTVGTALIQLCRMLKLRAVAVVRPRADVGEWDALVARLRALGAAEVLPDGGALRAQLDERKFFAKPRLALDAVGGASAVALAETLQDGCPLVVYGCMSGKPPQFSWSQWVFKELVVRGFNLRTWMGNNKKKVRGTGRSNPDEHSRAC